MPSRLLVAAGALVLSGCAPWGLIYTHKVEPLTIDYNQTPVVGTGAAGDVKQLEYYVRVLWSSNGIGAIAKENGFAKVYYADLETLSVFGIWTQTFVHVYGTKESAVAE